MITETTKTTSVVGSEGNKPLEAGDKAAMISTSELNDPKLDIVGDKKEDPSLLGSIGHWAGKVKDEVEETVSHWAGKAKGEAVKAKEEAVKIGG